MARIVKFPLIMKGVEVRTLDELKNNFDVESVVGYFNDGRLIIWLRTRHFDDEADKVAKLKKNDPSLHKKLCEIFGVESEVEDLDIGEIARRTERLNKLKQYTYDKEILKRVDLVAFNQDDLDSLIKKGESLIYLCNNEFDIPLAYKNKTYVGIGKAIAVIHSSVAVNFERLNIKFKNITFDDNYIATLKTRDLIERQRQADEKAKLSKKLYDEGNAAYENENYQIALKKFKESANLGYSESFTKLGLMYYFGQGVDADISTARDWFKRGIENGDGNSYGYYASTLLYDGEPTEDDKRQAFKYMKRATELEPNDGTWWYELGDMYHDGKGTSKNLKNAFRCYERAANFGEVECLKKLGEMYFNGEYVEENPVKVFDYIKKAAVAGDVESMYDVGKMYLDGYGVAKDDVKAFRWIKKAAYAENLDAMYTLADMFWAGQGTQKNILEALNLFNRAAELGHTDAIVALGCIYYNGDDVQQDFQKAAQYFKKAADADNAEGMNRLGLMFFNGQGVGENFKMAFQYFENAAKRDNATAMANVGYCYLNGIGVSKNMDNAGYWLKKSAENEDFNGMEYYADYLYEQGDFTARNWYKKAFKQSNEGSIAYKIYMIYKEIKNTGQAEHWKATYESLGYVPDENSITSKVGEVVSSSKVGGLFSALKDKIFN